LLYNPIGDAHINSLGAEVVALEMERALTTFIRPSPQR
jgi:hypothetical protein